MIRIHLAKLAEAKDYNKTSLHFASGLSYPTILRYWSGDVKQFDGIVIETLCKFLQCELCELIEIVDDSISTSGTVSASGDLVVSKIPASPKQTD